MGIDDCEILYPRGDDRVFHRRFSVGVGRADSVPLLGFSESHPVLDAKVICTVPEVYAPTALLVGEPIIGPGPAAAP